MQTKFEIIETPDYILAVSDEEIKNDEYYISWETNYSTEPKERWVIYIKSIGLNGTTPKKIIAHLPKGNAPALDLPLLPEVDVEDDIEKLAEEYVIDESYLPVYKEECKRAYINGHKAATKTYSEDDLIQLAGELSFKWHNGEIKDLGSSIGWSKRYVESLKQPKTPKCFVAEMETARIPYGDDGWKTIETGLKTTTINGEVYLVGKYIYE
jgi:hypothetical protein